MGDSQYIPLHSAGECYLCDIFHRVYINPEGGIEYHQKLYQSEDDDGNTLYRLRLDNQPVEPYVQPEIMDNFIEFFHELRGPVCWTATDMTVVGGIFFMLIIVWMEIFKWVSL